ncbi:MAG TPA: DUF6691 family protein [Acetobacteraceae bacterium]|nr:DUF6691 family protein [Acetobacteraceae bacterium]
MTRILVGLLAGLLFGLGLTVSHMIDPAKVIGFLNIAGDWDPSLALVLFAAVTVAFAGFALARRWAAPLCDTRFSPPGKARLDMRLIAGAVLFGIGWGMVGYCPGPALASLSVGGLATLTFVAAMLTGMLLFNLLDRRLPASQQPAA